MASAPLLSSSMSSSSYIRKRLSHHHHLPFTFSPPKPLFSKICLLNSWRSTSPLFMRDAPGKVSCSQVEVEESMEDEACELVNGTEVVIGDGADSVRACFFNAVKNNNQIGILFLTDIFGFEDSSTRDFAYRVACNGYNVLVPDLFRGNPWAKDKPKALFDEWLANLDLQRVLKDIAASKKWMVDEFVAAGITKKLGVIGFCYGGGRVIDALSLDEGSCFGTGISFYGTRIDPSVAANVKVPILFVAGDNDPLCPVTIVKDIEKSIGKGSRAIIYEGRGHGFAHRPESPEEDTDADDAFNAMRNWLHDKLVVNS